MHPVRAGYVSAVRRRLPSMKTSADGAHSDREGHGMKAISFGAVAVLLGAVTASVGTPTASSGLPGVWWVPGCRCGVATSSRGGCWAPPSWGPMTAVSGLDVLSPAAALAPDGTATVAWQSDRGIHVTLPRSGSVSSSSASPGSPDKRWDRATPPWREWTTRASRPWSGPGSSPAGTRCSTRHRPGGSWTAPVEIRVRRARGRTLRADGVSPTGAVAVAWQDAPRGGSHRLRAVYRPGGKTWTRPTTLAHQPNAAPTRHRS